MVRADEIREHMEVIGADGVHVGTVDKVEGERIKLTKQDSGSHGSHHHFLSLGLVATVEGDQVRLSATGANAALLEEEQGGEAISDKSMFDWRTLGLGAAAVAGIAAAAAAAYVGRSGRDTDGRSGRKTTARKGANGSRKRKA